MNAIGYFGTATCPQQQGTNLQADTNFPYWLSTLNDQVDCRLTFVKCCGDLFCSQFPTEWPDPATLVQSVSPVSGQLAMFTTEALYYAQSGYFVTIVMIQWSNVFSCKSRKVIFMLFR